jgi:hypothetical protein
MAITHAVKGLGALTAGEQTDGRHKWGGMEVLNVP